MGHWFATYSVWTYNFLIPKKYDSYCMSYMSNIASFLISINSVILHCYFSNWIPQTALQLCDIKYSSSIHFIFRFLLVKNLIWRNRIWTHGKMVWTSEEFGSWGIRLDARHDASISFSSTAKKKFRHDNTDPRNFNLI